MVIYREKEIRSITIGKEEAILSLFLYGIIILLENHENQSRMLRINKISTKWWDSKKSITILDTDNNFED